MSDRQTLAEQGAGLCAWGLGALGAASVNPILAPVAITATLIYDRLAARPKSRAKAAVTRALKALDDSPEYTERTITAATQLLKSQRCKIDIDLTSLKIAEKRGNFPDTLYETVFDGAAVPKDDGIEDVLRLVIAAAFEELRHEPAFDTVFQQESLKAIEAGQAKGFQEMTARFDHADTQFAEILRRFDGLAGAVASADSLSLAELATLAERFGNTEISQKPALVDFLTKKAEEYLALKSEVDAIDDGLKRLSNLKSAAQGAIDRVDLEEVENLLSRVQEVELEEAAKTAELRANNALLRGRVEQAYSLLSAAADSFAAIDPLEPARRRILQYFMILRNHGLRFGGSGLPLSRDLLHPILTEGLKAQDAWLWAAGQNTMAIALQNQGTRTGGEDGTRLLAEAVASYRNALTIGTKADHPVDWASTQNNLGTALSDQGLRTGGEDGTRLLAEAVAAFRDALTISTKAGHPVQWAMTQNNLANALKNQGIRTGREGGTRLLAEAVAAYRAALSIRTKADHPVDWATTQNNLAIALQNQGTRIGGEDGTRLLAEAVTAYRNALTIYTKADHPVDWAMTQNNLGTALQDQGTRTDGEDGTRLLAEAVAAYRAALSIRTKADHPVDWAMTNENLAIAELAIADHAATTEPRPHVEAALAYVEASLIVFDPEHMSFNHEKATRLRDRIKSRLDAAG